MPLKLYALLYFLHPSRCRGTKTQKPFCCVAGAGQAVLALKGRKSLVQTELWSWVLAGFPSSLSPLRFLGIKKKKKKNLNTQTKFSYLQCSGKVGIPGRADPFPKLSKKEEKTA